MNEQTILEQVINGVFKAFFILCLPFIRLYFLLKWFVVSVIKETGNRLVKITAIALTGIIVTLVAGNF